MVVSYKNLTLHRSKSTQVAKELVSTQVQAALVPLATVINIPVRHKKQVRHPHHQKRKVALRHHHHQSHQITIVRAVVTVTTIHPANLSLHMKGINHQQVLHQQLQNPV